MTFQEKLPLLRERTGDSQESLAEAVGLARNQISRWEDSRRSARPDPEVVVAIANHFGVPVGWLIDPGQDWPPPIGQEETERDVWKAVQRLGAEESYRRLMKIPDGLAAPTPMAPRVSDPARHRRRGRKGHG